MLFQQYLFYSDSYNNLEGPKLQQLIGDQICGKYRLKTYPSNFLISDFKIEELSDETFCEKFITKL